MANQYSELKNRQQKEFNDFPMKFAFSDEQFKEGMAELGLKEDETDKLYKFGGTGGFYRKTDAKALQELLTRHEEEKAAAVAADTTGDGYLYEMFKYELGNHEYTYTGSLTQTLDALDLTIEKVNADPRLLHALNRAKKEAWEWAEKHNYA